jgi:starch synthase
MIASEAAPLAKTGGLADVVGALPGALGEIGCETAVVIPRYGSIPLKDARRVYDHLPIYLAKAGFDIAIYQAPAKYPLYLVECPRLFDRPGFYGEAGVDFPDNDMRFAVFARAALGVARWLFRPDILHCHDWQAGLVPAYLGSTLAGDPTFMGIKTLFTIHNLGYQGLFPAKSLQRVALDKTVFNPGGLEFFGQVSFLKSGISFGDAVSTVSPTYAREIRTPEYGCGLDGVLRGRDAVLSGILNGADYGEWSPENDLLIPARYSAQDLSGKRAAKERLLAEMGLPAEAIDRPLLSVVSRLVEHKGVALVAEAAAGIVAGDAYMVALGEGDPKLEKSFRALEEQFPGRVAVRIGYDNRLSHLIYAGADMFLMPSRYEPCGLSQLYGLRYGTVPVVRATGGLDDTIEESTGFKFQEYSSAALLGAIRDAVQVFLKPEAWRAMMLRGMQKDFSWKASAREYAALYGRLAGRQ